VSAHGQRVRFVNMFIGCLPFAISSWPSWYSTFCSNFILFSWCHICHLHPTLATCCLLLYNTVELGQYHDVTSVTCTLPTRREVKELHTKL